MANIEHIIPQTGQEIDEAIAWALRNKDFDPKILKPIQGFLSADSTADLPETPTRKQMVTGYIISGEVWLWDVKDLQWKNCGALQGDKGEKGDKGNDGVVLEGVTLADSIEDVKTATTPSKTVPTANAMKETDEAINGEQAKTKTRSTASSARVNINASDFGLTYFKKGTQLTFLLGGAASSATLYSTKSNGTTNNLGYIYNGTEKIITVATDDITNYYAYKSGTGKSLTCTIPATGGIVGQINELKADIDNLQTDIDDLNFQLSGSTTSLSRTIDISSSVPRVEITAAQGKFGVGNTISVHFADGLSSYHATLYRFYTDGTYVALQTADKQDWVNLVVAAPTGKTFSHYRWRFRSLTEKTNPTVSVTVEVHGDIDVRFAKLQEQVESASPTGVKAVILGDSYSQMGRWVNALKKIINFDQLTNLGVGGANLKDIYSWKSWPYTDRPYQTKVMPNGTEHNYNLINSQLEWLKRLVTDQCRGVYYEIAFKTSTADGNIALTISETTYNVAVTSGQTASVIAENVAALNIPDHVLIHPTGAAYVTIEAQLPSVTDMGAVEATGTTATVTKLRSAEKPIYQDGDHPDFIIIEAGKNDTPDTDDEVAEYMSSVLVKMTGKVKQTADSSVTDGSVYLPPSKDELNRTTFCGELSYLVREIYELFPKAIMLVVGPSSLKGGNSGLANEIKKDEQMRLACRYLNIPYVSWIDDGIINRVVNFPSGNGTASDPWVYNCATVETTDMLHPNDLGGMKLALPVAQKIRELISYRNLIRDY